MKLELGKVYLDGDGREVRIVGVTREHLAWVYSLSGYWYVQETGERLTYGPDGTGGYAHYISPRKADHLVKEAR